MNSFKKIRQRIGRGLVFVFLIGIISSGLALSAPTPVLAVDPGGVTQVIADAAQGACVNPSPGAAPCVAKGVSETSKSLWDKIITPSLKMIAVKSLIDFVSFASNRIAYEAAVYIANGGPGEGSMFYNKSVTEGFGDLTKDIAGEAFGNLSDITKGAFGLDLCVPPNPLLRLNLQLSIKQNYTVQKPKCDFDSVTSQWGQVVSDATALLENDKDARDTFLFNKFAEGLKPGNNELGASIGFLQATNEEAQKTAQLETAAKIGSIPIGGFTNVKDLVTGQTKTPAAIVATQFADQLKAAKGDENKIKPGDVLANPDVWYGLLNMSVSTFTNTLTSQLFNRVYKGLFSPQPENADPFNTELAGGSGGSTSASKADLSGIFTATPVANPQFDLLGEFAQCPPDGTGNRGLNSCVIDVSVVSAISRGGGSGSLTVQEAIDQKVLNGDWPLISPKDQSANQDRLCYTYGFCYGNLVKLRKARIISIGWELAAEKNSLNNPKSLKEIVAGFNDCNEQGQIDASHPWCHLIDPNWVLKAPESQCRASVNGEIRVSAQAAGRQSVCADAPTCIGEDSTGKCVQGFGYCVQEKNIWRVKGDECPAQYATCLTFANTHSGKAASYLLNTVDNANCTKQNAGCLWNKTQKVADQAGVFQWFTGTASYNVAATSNTLRYNGSTASSYSYQDRLYTTHNVEQCDAAQAGCTELNVKNGGLSLNLVQNGSFEKDEDQNGMPDGWRNTNTSAVPFTVDDAVDGIKSAKANGGYFYQSVQASSGSFYTFSLYAKGTDSNQKIDVSLYPKTANGTNIAFSGLSFGGDCLPTGGNHYEIVKNLTTAGEWKRFTCTLTLPATAAQVEVDLYDLNTGAPKVQYDGIQLEAGEVASSFRDGYSTASPAKTYLKVAPSYLGCKGLDGDPEECSDYAPVCSALDVGCNLYAPKESGPSVSAIASALDACPNVCVGYDSYRQEGTKYEPAKFPVHFIADKAGVCSANAIGCDGFTKLGTNGGETQEYYTNLRACLTPEMADGSGNKTSATYFTWEGSDNSGFQLKTWQLLQSDVNAAPCTKSSVDGGTSVKCIELAPPAVDASCNVHADIFTNPDCREFFDNAGDIHYRLFSKTVTVDASCAAYRKNTSTSADCTVSGGFWTDQGFCRYFGLQKESKACSASENGCREYTGGAGRNATTILKEEFESGTIGSFVATASATAQPSNDSVSSGGHSVRVIPSNTNDVGIETIPTALSSSLVKGKVYTLQFWAKGSGTLSVGFQDKNNGTKHFFVENMDLTNTWSVYAVGPMDTSSFAAFDKDAKLFFTTKSGKEFFVDNITLTQAAENITRIKDSWVTPAVCDQSPNGAISPQYYLGCKAYTDRKGKEESYYQFTRVCSEKAIGCSAYYNTYNSESPYAQVANARCVNVGSGTLPNGVPSTTNKPCVVNGVTYCTISVGQNHCVFSAKQAFSDPLPNDTVTKFAIVYGPEAVVTPQDQSIFLVDNGNAQCNESFKGCREVGAPTFAQDLKTVTKFESKYVLDTPDDYKNILCENQALFCDEFSSTKDGNFYFKNPLDKTCEYKTSVTIGNKLFNGWFRSGKSEPCYWTDGTGANADGVYKPGTTDTAYLISGDQSQIWKNGDVAYDGWIGACDTSANRCTELIDATDTSPENHGKGKSYYVINNDKLLENSVTLTEKCEGKVGQKAGCALFDNTTISQRKYSSSASYVLSVHADLLLNKPENSLVDPISCAQGGGVFNISKETAQKIGTPSATTVDLCAQRCFYNSVPAGDEIISPNAQQAPYYQVGGSPMPWFERSCLVVSDCPDLKTKLGKTISATNCSKATPGASQTSVRVQDDANTILKVNRDRTCAAWLACNSSRTTWDAGSNKYIQICDSINLCTQSGSQGDQAQCASWSSRAPVVMTEQYYSSRDVSWAGVDYSGYQIPHQLPVERFNQFNLNPKKWCEKNTTKSCETNSGCLPEEGGCVDAPSDYRLVNNAGPCSGADASACQVGFCKNTKTACSSNENCGTDAANFCVFGYCQQVSTTKCSANSECSGATATCDPVQGVCVDHLLNKPDIAWACSTTTDCKGPGTQKCVTATTTAAGTCYQNRCLTDIRDSDGNGFAEPLQKDKSDNIQSCRGYPEFDSPFPQKVVALWKIFPKPKDIVASSIGIMKARESMLKVVDGKTIIELSSSISSPAQFVSGYDTSKVCTPICDKEGNNCVANDECLCSYTKAVYGKGSESRYYPTDLSLLTDQKVPSGICTGGLKEGMECNTDEQCSIKAIYPGDDSTKPPTQQAVTGICQHLSTTNTMFGWQGYCLEKDTSIQLNGSTADKDRACLTWLPIDQLSGATDLYGKDMSAGYQIASNTYYCAQPGVAWDLPTSSGFACAESSGGCSDTKGQSSFTSEDKASSNVYCPKNYFAVAEPCGDNATKGSGGDPLCSNDDEQGFTYSNYDNDYPYFCVPKGSKKTSNTDGNVGDSCLTPQQVKDQKIKTFSSLTSMIKNQNDVEIYYFTGSGDWDTARKYYLDCSVKGVFDVSTHLGKEPYTISSNGSVSGGSDSDGYRYLKFDFNEFAACKNVVQVAQMGTLGNLNAAWTNRVWQSSKFETTTGSYDLLAGYKVSAEPQIFGQVKDGIEGDSSPKRILMCGDVMAPASGTCEEPAVLSGPPEARAYSKVSLELQKADGFSGICSPNTGAKDCNSFYEKGICSFQNTQCIGKWKCVAGPNPPKGKCDKGPRATGFCTSDSDCNDTCENEFKKTNCINKGGECQGTGFCKAGPNKNACESDNDCLTKKCVENPEVSKGKYAIDDGYICIDKDKSFGALSVSSDFSQSDAKKRLGLIFARAYELFDYKDKEKKYLDEKINAANLWFWDNRTTANWSQKSGTNVFTPNPPIITSLGNCIGSSCPEKRPNQFSVNGEDTGVIEGTGSKHVSVTFYVHADSNQMPLRNIVIDWGDDIQGLSSGNPWPNGHMTGSIALSNFYKNRRGLDAKANPPKEICSSGATEFGKAPEACSSSYVLFTNDYVCTSSDVAVLPACKIDVDSKTKSIVNSPCFEVDDKGDKFCVFQPRIHAKDNWGWCTGYCDANPPGGDTTNSCFDQECAIDLYPSSGLNNEAPLDKKTTNKIVNPWTYFDGKIKIKPVQ